MVAPNNHNLLCLCGWLYLSWVNAQLGRLLLEAVHNNHTATVVSLLMAGSYTGTTSLVGYEGDYEFIW